MNDELQAFLGDPTFENFFNMRTAILADPGYEPHSLRLAELASLCEQGRLDEVGQAISRMMPGWMLSPRVHLFAGYLAVQRGDDQEVETERFLLDTCLQGLFATGDGMRGSPYLVTYRGDEYDVLDALSRRACSQRLVERGSSRYDVIACEDGTEVWFDVTDLFRPRMAKLHQKAS